jgi:hypothetical protein
VICDDTDDTVNYVVNQYFQATDRGEAYRMPPELTEEEQLAVAVLIDVYARVCSCRQCWASKYRGL